MNAASMIAAIAPVLLILGLGFAAGKHRSFDADQAKGFSHLALVYALPAALFLGMAHFDRAVLLRQGPIALVMLLGYGALFIALYLALRFLGLDQLKATLLGYAMSSTAVPIYGLTVMVPLYGEQVAIGIVGLAALITNLGQVSIAVFLLQSAVAHPSGAAGTSPVELEKEAYSAESSVAIATLTKPKRAAVTAAIAPSVWLTFARSAANPLLWCPMLGAALALCGLRLSPYVSATLAPLAAAAAGVAIFASGLALAGHPVKLTSKAVVVGSLVCLIVQPALFFGMIKVAGLTGTMPRATLVASTMPTSTLSVLLAQQYRTLEAETAGIMLVTTVAMAVVVPAGIALSTFL